MLHETVRRMLVLEKSKQGKEAASNMHTFLKDATQVDFDALKGLALRLVDGHGPRED